MKRSRQTSKWNLGDVVDFEMLLEHVSLWKQAWRGRVRELVEQSDLKTQKARRRLGFREMLEFVREKKNEESGEHVTIAARTLEVLVGVLMFIFGVALVRGLLVDYSYPSSVGVDVIKSGLLQGFNIWIFLALTVGVQWLILLSAFLGYIFYRKWSGSLSLLQIGLGSILRRLGGLTGIRMGNARQSKWRPRPGSALYQLWGWRLTRILQSGGIGYNLGLIIGLFGCLWFLNVGFYWETSLPQFGESSLYKTSEVLTAPIGGGVISKDDVKLANKAYTLNGANESESHIVTMEDYASESLASLKEKSSRQWAWFFFIVLAIWGLLPRVILWSLSWWMERRTLADMEFQDAAHRNLWRDVTRVQRGVVSNRPTDGAVVLDVGGLSLDRDELRPYFLQVMRVNPEGWYSLGTLDKKNEEAALSAAKKAAKGCVFIVEGWSLSPKQMVIYHRKLREVIGEKQMIRYLVINGNEEERNQWAHFVDSLEDAESEVYQYDEKACEELTQEEIKVVSTSDE